METNAMIALAAAIAIGIGAYGGTQGQGKAAAAALEGIARNPGAQQKIFVPMILALALIESLVILSFVVANALVGKL
jgi:F-type H+-transporting ATPase subunit c